MSDLRLVRLNDLFASQVEAAIKRYYAERDAHPDVVYYDVVYTPQESVAFPLALHMPDNNRDMVGSMPVINLHEQDPTVEEIFDVVSEGLDLVNDILTKDSTKETAASAGRFRTWLRAQAGR